MIASIPKLITRARNLLICYEADEPVAAEFRAQQVRAVLRITPLAIVANVFNVIIVCLTFTAHARFPWLLVWGALVILCVAFWYRPWRALRLGRVRRTVSLRAITRATKHAAILGTLWGILPLVMFPSGDAHAQMLVTVISCGMICAGGFALATIPSAAMAYVLIMITGCGIALVLDGLTNHLDLLFLMFSYAFIVCSSVIASARTFGARLMAEAKAAHQQQVVGLLLNDFESHASDWLWEMDAQGYLQRMSIRVIEFFGLSRATLRNRKFIDFFGFPLDDNDDQEEALAAVHKLRDCLEQSAPFRDLAVPVIVDGERRWWSLTAKPLLDANGQPAGWRGVGSDITHGRQADREMRRLATVDSLTGLANRYWFRQQLDAICKASGSHGSECALFYFDLDNFKNVNDSLGHGGGDRVLQIVAKRLLERSRRGDLLARLGGDEFALLSHGSASREQAAIIAERLLDAFREPCLIDGVNLQVSTSIGIALSGQSSDPDTALKHADMALYAAKSKGRNTYQFFDASMGEHVQRRLGMLNDLHNALESGAAALARDSRDKLSTTAPFQFELHFQPQIHLKTGRVIGMEGLMRWNHPTRGLLPPAAFIPLLEESGLIVPLGTWALREACCQAMTWPGEQRVAVNVSAVQFAQHAVVEAVREALTISRLPAHRLELEVTESLLIHDNQAAQETLVRLRALGVRIALDDFGTGYSSLAYLRSFPFDKLKIDRAFIMTLGKDPSAYAIVRAIIGLAEALKLETTAEGVEQADQAEVLRAIGCHHAQGYFFAQPMAAEAVVPYLTHAIAGYRQPDWSASVVRR